MRYLCLVYSVEDPENELSESEARALADESLAYDEVLHRTGQFIAAAALQPPDSATIVSVRDGRMITTDGPFSEAKEQVAGIILIEAKDLNDAIQVASKSPPARYGFIEVRQVWELTDPVPRREK